MQLSNGDDSLTGQSDIKIRMMGGNDYLEVTGGTNYANGNMGEDTIILRGGFGEYLGGKDSDTIEVFASEEGTSVNGNLGEDYITGFVAGVTYRGGKDNDVIAVNQGKAWGDKGEDVFVGVAGEGFAVIQDYTIGEDFVEIAMEGSWSNLGDGLMFTDENGDQIMLLLGIDDVEQITLL
jgi:Ca2+-binding RTX toxin-like protein